jgi:hypothetical protein
MHKEMGMNRQIQQIMSASEGRYLSAAEQGVLREFAQGMEARLAAMAEISGKENAIIGAAIQEIFRAYPDVEKKYKNAQQSGYRDQALVLRYASLAMVRSDPDYLSDTLLTWLKTILRGVGFTPQFLEDAYSILERTASKELSPSSAKLLQPYLAQCTRTLSGKQGGAQAGPQAGSDAPKAAR